MNVELKIFHKHGIEKTTDFKKVELIANKLCNFMNTSVINKKIRDTHKVGIASKEIQEILLPETKKLGFTSEKKGIFKEYPSSGLRPDYFKRVNNNTGIIMEVERGKTTTNNMDMLDIWKCHICKEANYLFMIVPMIRQTQKGNSTQVFNKVVKRVSSFYHKENYINIDGVFILGY
jgi:hypothetical protein